LKPSAGVFAPNNSAATNSSGGLLQTIPRQPIRPTVCSKLFRGDQFARRFAPNDSAATNSPGGFAPNDSAATNSSGVAFQTTPREPIRPAALTGIHPRKGIRQAANTNNVNTAKRIDSRPIHPEYSKQFLLFLLYLKYREQIYV
jgi:hypothetical protein